MMPRLNIYVYLLSFKCVFLVACCKRLTSLHKNICTELRTAGVRNIMRDNNRPCWQIHFSEEEQMI